MGDASLQRAALGPSEQSRAAVARGYGLNSEERERERLIGRLVDKNI
jgi:hypothetical protein